MLMKFIHALVDEVNLERYRRRIFVHFGRLVLHPSHWDAIQLLDDDIAGWSCDASSRQNGDGREVGEKHGANLGGNGIIIGTYCRLFINKREVLVCMKYTTYRIR
jgi:hypothetical protein